MKTNALIAVFLAILAFAAVLPVAAFEWPLSSEGIREAYFVGKMDGQRRAAVFEKYTLRPPMPMTGPSVTILVETPFVVIAENISQRVSNYFSPDALQEYVDKPVAFRVRAEIDVPSGLSEGRGQVLLSPEDSPSDYTIRLFQDQGQDRDKELPAKSVYSWPVYNCREDGGCSFVGWGIKARYDPAKIESEPTKVQILMPHDQRAEATIDLGALQ
jgi:hypothetical protein